jgi:hypothetical protein
VKNNPEETPVEPEVETKVPEQIEETKATEETPEVKAEEIQAEP